MSQFNYGQLVWVCHNRTKNNNINRLHERCLSLIYSDKKNPLFRIYWKKVVLSLFRNPYYRNLRTVAVEMYKIHHGISSTIMNKIFTLRHQNQYNLRT